jgi:hypothetical protein
MPRRPDIISRTKASSHPLAPGRFYDAQIKRIESDGKVVISIQELGISFGPVMPLNTTDIQFYTVGDFVKCTFKDEFFREIIIFGSILKKQSIYIAKTEAAWQTFSPVVSQGVSTNISKTVDYSSYSRSANTCSWNCLLSLTGTGTTANSITLSLPIAAAVPQYAVIGTALIKRSSTQYVLAAVISDSESTKVAFQSNAAGLAGVDPVFALAPDDVISISATYEVTE